MHVNDNKRSNIEVFCDLTAKLKCQMMFFPVILT